MGKWPSWYAGAVKLRLDRLLVERGLVPSRERGQALILAGRVLVDEQKVEKAGAAVASDAVIRLLGDDLPYVSRGGLKLAAALAHWHIDVSGRVCMDVGASTGGFTDCLLQNGATASHCRRYRLRANGFEAALRRAGSAAGKNQRALSHNRAALARRFACRTPSS